MRIFAYPWAVALLFLIAPAEAAARGTDPRVPPGVDPGGVAVALISTGIDYTLPHISTRLARDGEGDIIGRDLADDDAFPYGPEDSDGNGTALASLVLAESASAKLVPVRIDSEPSASLARALAFVAQTPARVVLVSSGGFLGDPELFREAALHFAHLLIIMAADDVRNVPADDVANLLTPPTLAAAARAAATALEIADSEPDLDGAGLKRAVLERLARIGWSP